ncbi:hypothetical protein YTPLAS18_06430 [Nitrospira sp.]|nr:hypothetical protein YTPLAS18_06430 [Nitrospira sp.]
MAQIFHSGAFVQQCFAVHPLCLSVKRYEGSDRMVLTCTSCNMSHRLTVGEVLARLMVVPSESGVPLTPESSVSPAEQLAHCAAEHAPALSVRAVDVVEELIGLRCGECRRVYELTIPAIETHQR